MTTLPATSQAGPARRFGRPQRVAALLCVVVLLSIGDLYMTLTHLTGIGMLESNPIARMVMSYNSTAAVVSWKCATVLLAVLVLFFYRRTRQAELASWICTVILAALTLHWIRYNHEIHALDPEDAARAARADPRWVAITDQN
jgi:hypothetical protein